MTYTAVQRAERAVRRVTSRRQVPLTQEVRWEIAHAVVESQESACGLPVERYDMRLTGRQLTVLRLVARGAGTLEIASRLGVSELTVKSHVRGAMKTLGARDRAHAVALGFAFGLLTVADVRPVVAGVA